MCMRILPPVGPKAGVGYITVKKDNQTNYVIGASFDSANESVLVYDPL